MGDVEKGCRGRYYNGRDLAMKISNNSPERRAQGIWEGPNKVTVWFRPQSLLARKIFQKSLVRTSR
jgi:hypothetical protein